MLLGDLAADGQTETGTGRAGAETGLENVGQMLGRNPRPGVGNYDQNLPASVDCAATQFDPPASGHGVHRIEHQVQQHLLQAVTVGGEKNSLARGSAGSE